MWRMEMTVGRCQVGWIFTSSKYGGYMEITQGPIRGLIGVDNDFK